MRTLLLLFLLTSFNLNAQTITEQELIGQWRAIKRVEMKGEIPEEMKEQISIMQNAFMNTTFVFKKENKYKFDFPIDEMKLMDGYWKLNGETGDISIYEQQNEQSYFMGIKAFKKEGKMMFMIEETYFAFEVEKE